MKTATVIAVVAQKGGAGKTTTTQNLGAALAIKGKSVLLVDLDPQGNLTDTAPTDADDPAAVCDVLTGARGAEAALQGLSDKLAIIPGGVATADAEASLKATDDAPYKLRYALAPVLGRYDFVLVDTPPALNLLTTMALTAASKAIITAPPEAFGARAITALVQTIAARAANNPGLTVAGVLLTRYRAWLNASKITETTITGIAQSLGLPVFKTRIRDGAAVLEAQILRRDVIAYAPKSNPAQDYKALAGEVMKLCRKGN